MSSAVQNRYENGELIEMKTPSGATLWKLTASNEYGQPLSLHKGKTKELLDYNSHFPKTQTVQREDTPLNVLQYDFNTQRGMLNHRTYSFYNQKEEFAYDTTDRLTRWGNATHQYDERGRITENSAIGTYEYTRNGYQQQKLTTNEAGETYLEKYPLPVIRYNAFKAPEQIYVKDKERISYDYNTFGERSHCYYGNAEVEKAKRPLLKHYSHDGSAEVLCNKTDNSTKFVFYLGGDAYSAPAVLISDGETQKLYYLHRDYLGSIVMLTDENGNIAERRHFDPWGQVVKVEDGSGKVLQGLTLLDRGFTGHEHLQTVGLIHMNGRLYDPALHRFLQPDNYVQDPFNTQNFNRYGYCLNNPLLYTDPTGEWFVIDDAIAMLVGGVVNLTINAIQGNVTSFWSGLGYFAVGVGAGAASLYGGPLAAGAVLGLGNNITSQVSQNGWSNISLTSAIIDTGIGMGSAYLGGQISSKFSGVFSKVFNSISSPILKNVLISGTSNAASGFLLSAGISFAYTKDFDQALKDGVKGAGYGLVLGSALGVVQGFQYAREKGVNPWNGIIYEEKLIQRSAIFADDFVTFTKNDGVTGTLKHQAASTLLKRYQNIYGDRGLRFGEYFNNNKILGLGNRGFLDVVNHKTMNIYDFKFGGADWRKGQFEKYQRNYKGYKIFKIKP